MVAEVAQTAEERAQRIIRCNFPDVEIPEVSISEFVLERASERGDKPAMIEGASGRTLSFAQLAEMVRRVAAGLAAHGLAKGDVLGIYSPSPSMPRRAWAASPRRSTRCTRPAS
jgi:long-subunit acyl-CoA synthetase (AMP-forming)